jgi:cytochrome P450
MTPPADPIAAVTHPDPYPFYAEMTARRPVHRDDALELWVVASAEAAALVLQEERCRVRPPTEPVPKALQGTAAGEVFGRLVRMNDGPRHAPLKAAVSRTLDIGTRAAAACSTSARRLVNELRAGHLSLREVQFHMPVHAVGRLLGLPEHELPATVGRVDALARGFAAGAQTEQVAAASRAAQELFDLVARSMPGSAPEAFLPRLHDEMHAATGDNPRLLAANAIGFLTQSYEATAGLIGNALLILVENDAGRGHLGADPRHLRQFLLEVARYDPPVQNTRRWVAVEGNVAGQEVKEGDGILVVLAAANRDPAGNPDPHRFDIDRSARRSFTFGAGAHGCPGENLAVSMAEALLAELLTARVPLASVRRPVAYRPAANVRIPLL